MVDHPTHKRARLARIKAQQRAKDEVLRATSLAAFTQMSSPAPNGLKKENTSRPSLISSLDASFGSTSGRVSLASNATNSFNIKPEPSEPIMPQKRLSNNDSANTSFIKAEPFPLDNLMPPAKKVKSEVPKFPLATVDRNNAVPPVARSELEEIDRILAQKRDEMYVFSGHRRRTKEDKARFTWLSKEIDHLLLRRNMLIAQIAATAPPAQALVPATLSLQPAVKLEAVQSGSGVPAGPNRYQPYTQMQPYALGLPPTEDRKPVAVPPTLAMASGSNVRLPDVSSKMDVDGEDHYIPPNIHFVHEMYDGDRNGYGKDYDQDGNWMGRGRDRFVGPTAAKDE